MQKDFSFSKETKITASDVVSNPGGGDRFGYSVAIDGNYAIVGAYNDLTNGVYTGSAYIFNVTTGTELHKVIDITGASGDGFGWSVAISGNYAGVGVYGDDNIGSNSGSVFIFNVTTGTQLYKLTANDAAASDMFGRNVAISGNYAIIGAKYNDDNGSNSGSAYIFDLTSGTQLHKLTASDKVANDHFGRCVDIHSNYAIKSNNSRLIMVVIVVLLIFSMSLLELKSIN